MTCAHTVQLGDLMAEKTGSVTPSQFPGESFDLYSIPAFDVGRPDIVTGSQIGSNKQILRSGDVLLSKIVPHIRRTWVVGADRGRRLIGSGEWIVFRNERVHPSFLRHLLRSDAFHASFMTTVAGVGGSLLRARPSSVARIKIVLPDLLGQQRIAAILDQAETLRTKRREALSRLDLLPQALFLEMFDDPSTTTFPTVRIKDLVTRLTNGFVGPTRDIYREAGVPYLLAKHVKEGRLLFDGRTFVTQAFNQRHSKSILKTGDVLVVQSGHVGHSAVVPQQHNGHNCHAMIIVSPKWGVLNGEYLSALLRTRYFLSKMKAIETGMTLAHLNCRDLREVPIPVPPFALQISYSEQLNHYQTLRTKYSQGLQEADELFSSLQHRAFNGEL